MSVYSANNGYAGYHNYMKYWAKNGDYNWICNSAEYSGKENIDKINNQPLSNILGNYSNGNFYYGNVYMVKYTYFKTDFWNNFDGTTDVFGNKKDNKQYGPKTFNMIWDNDKKATA